MKKRVLIKSIVTMLLGVIIATGSIAVLSDGEPPQPEMAAIEYNINI